MVSLPRKRAPGEPADETYAAIDASAKPGSDLNKGMRAIKDADPTFEPKSFVDGAKMAYEMIVMAYADGDRKTLKNLLVARGLSTASLRPSPTARRSRRKSSLPSSASTRPISSRPR